MRCQKLQIGLPNLDLVEIIRDFAFNHESSSLNMDIILKQKFDLETRKHGELVERFYQDKLLTPSVIFAIKHKKLAFRYSKIFKYINPAVYLMLVKEDNYIQVWYEKEEFLKSQKGADVVIKAVEASIEEELPLDREFVIICQKLLTDYIGPFSKIIIKKNVSKKPQPSRNEFIASLISEVIDKPNSAELVRKLEKLSS